MYKITFRLSSPIAFIDLPVFDSIISYCIYRDKYCKFADYNTPQGKELKEPDLYCLKQDSDYGFYCASFMCFEDNIESVEKWRKRWEVKFDYLADFGKARRRINTGSGKFKSYDMPLVVSSIDKVWFYFDGDAGEVERLVNTHLIGIGKKVKIGFGWFDKFDIEDVNDDKWLLYRPLPYDNLLIEKLRNFGFKVESGYGSDKPPYWYGENFKEILIPCV